MKKLVRPDLPPEVLQRLVAYTNRVLASETPAAEAARIWEHKEEGAFREVRATLEAMASGIVRCMYCEDSGGEDIEHFWPKSRYPQAAFCWANYLLACSECNSN